MKITFFIFVLVSTFDTFGQNPIPYSDEIFHNNVIPRVDIFLLIDSLNHILDDANSLIGLKPVADM